MILNKFRVVVTKLSCPHWGAFNFSLVQLPHGFSRDETRRTTLLIIFLMASLAPSSISWSLLFSYSGSHFLFFPLCTFSNFFFHYIIPLQLPCTLSLTLTGDIYSGRCCHVAVVIASRPCGSKWWKFLAQNWQAANLLYARNTHPHAELREWTNACTSTSIIRRGKVLQALRVVTGWCFQSDDVMICFSDFLQCLHHP